jgi:hypothetical protein
MARKLDDVARDENFSFVTFYIVYILNFSILLACFSIPKNI